MKICAVIAEYNPLHNGHSAQLKYVKEVLKADKIIVIMSGNFTQRGEAAVANKFIRAKWAILSGADMVIELPTVFALSNAEIFAAGAMKIAEGLKIVNSLCFGAESGDRETFISTASVLLNETKEFKAALKKELDEGNSLAKARYNAVKALNIEGVDETLITLPNNILGVEYTKALLKSKSAVDICPMIRTGPASHGDVELKKGKITSATSIRKALEIKKGKVKKYLPSYVYKALPKYPYYFGNAIMTKLITTPLEELKKVTDCTEGLENRIKALIKDNLVYETAVEKITTKRYTSSRIRRISVANLLGITDDLVTRALKETPYVKILAVGEKGKELISMIAKSSSCPVLTRKSDIADLNKTQQECFSKDVLANDIFNFVTREKSNEYFMVTV